MREMVEMIYLLTEPVIMDDSALQRLMVQSQRPHTPKECDVRWRPYEMQPVGPKLRGEAMRPRNDVHRIRGALTLTVAVSVACPL
jgi:hypothetical protein